MRTVESLIDYLFEVRHGEKWYREGEDKVPEMINLLREATKTVKIAVGELNPDNFEREKVIVNFSSLLGKHVEIIIVCHKADSKESAIEGFIKENPKLIELKKRFPDKLILYWQKERAEVHYCVVDEKHVRLDTPHLPYKGKVAVFKYNAEKLAKLWSERFDKLIANKDECQEIQLEEIKEVETKFEASHSMHQGV
ncbi:MAG TPA: hypothetical protein ACFYD3_06550 [Candidatus Hypogeohydataceae bacterium YC41]